MSGDVQPRKRKDKKRKKDDLGVSEPRGTAAALGDGDVFMHSQHDHGTGGNWCAKIVFFSLLAILVGLVGLIILENRGLSELEANAVQTQYSGVLEGWLEDAPEDDHHDEHTLELNHHEDEDDGDHGDAIEHSEEAENDQNNSQSDDADEEETLDDNYEDSQEQGVEDNDEDEEPPYRKYYQSNQEKLDDDNEYEDSDHSYQNDEDNNDENEENDDDIQNTQEDDGSKQRDAANDDGDDDDDDQNYQNYGLNQNYQEDDEDQDDDDNTEEYRSDRDDEDSDEDLKNNQSLENAQNSQEDDEIDKENDANEYDTHKIKANTDSQEDNNEDDFEERDDEDASLDVEKIEHEASDEEPISTELPALPEPDDDESAEEDGAGSDDDANNGDGTDDEEDPDDDFLEADNDEPPVERITAPAGKPFDEVEEEASSEKPADTLEEEEEYEKRQEELRREEAQASHMWLKLSVGAALLVAAHAIVRRAAAAGDQPQAEESASAEGPAVDRRMTLIPEEPSESVAIRKVAQESTRPVVQDVAKQIPSIIQSSPTFEDSEEEVEEEEQPVPAASIIAPEKLELYSDEEEAEDEEIEVEEIVKKPAPQVAKQPTPVPDPEEDVPDDVEIIDDEIEEEAEEDEDEEEISDVDDEELLTRLEAKYGRLPEPERPPRHKDGGNSVADEWPGEPSDAYWRQQLDQAEQEFNQGAWLAAAARAGAAPLRASGRARLLLAKSLDAAAEQKRDNALLGRAIAAYLDLLKMNERLSDKKLLEVTARTIDRIQFRGNYLNAEPVYRLLIRRFPDDPSHRNNLTVTFLMANRADLAEEVLKETLERWPDERLALAQYGFVLKTQHNRLEEAADYLHRALEGDTGPATEPRYYYHLGDTLLLLGRREEAERVHERGAARGHFLSPAQRSLYNAPGLRSRPWWNVEDTPYVKLARSLEKSWREILKEGEAAKALYEQEKEGLRERGEWGQLELFVRGREVGGRCARAPATCALVRAEPAAAGCRRGQVKFSVMQPGTHVRAHVGPTNCRLRMHLGLSNTTGTFLRVHRETRQWRVGEVLMFDDSFEHEVWHNGSGARLVLIVDVWHPDLSPAQRRTLPAI